MSMRQNVAAAFGGTRSSMLGPLDLLHLVVRQNVAGPAGGAPLNIRSESQSLRYGLCSRQTHTPKYVQTKILIIP